LLLLTEQSLSVQWKSVLEAGNTNFPDSSCISYDVIPHVASLLRSSISCSSRENLEVVAMLSITGHQWSLAFGCVFSSFGISVYSKVDSKPFMGDPRKNIRVRPSEYVRKLIDVGAIVDNDDNCLRRSHTISLNSCHVFLPSLRYTSLDEEYSLFSVEFSSSVVVVAVTVPQGCNE